MAIPVVTCDADVVLDYDASPRTQTLGATATGSPTSWRWDMLSVPPGSSANVGACGDFTDGIATIQNPSVVLTGAVDGGYCFQCRATNGDGQSDPAVDKRNGQQIVIVRTNVGQLWLPPDYGFDWGEKYINPTLRKLAADVAAIPGDDHLVLATSSDSYPGYLIDKLAAGSGIQLNDLGTSVEIVNTGGGGGGETPVWQWNGVDLSQFNIVAGNEVDYYEINVIDVSGVAWIEIYAEFVQTITDPYQRALWLVINDLTTNPYTSERT